ncbi:MAG: nucleotidyltransferase domain-containing protein [Phaeodactylibacter sp.]|nr:nucleotidyltransferase domain-containing protein [Phaeodactylibacter sp.]
MQTARELKRHLTGRQLQAIRSICPRFHVARLFLFGSALTDSFRPDSDIDLLVQFEKMAILEYADNYFGLLEQLRSITQRPVDLVIEKDLSNPILIESINETKVLIYDKANSEVAA